MRRRWWVLVAVPAALFAWHRVGPLFPVVYGVVGFDPLPVGYHDAPVRGVVVDADTSVPLEGVNVVARWRLQTYPFGRVFEDLVVGEAVTDAAGHYEIAWTREYYFRSPRSGFLVDYSPEILVFKDGYRFEVLTRRRGDTQPQNAALRPFVGTLEQYGLILRSFDNLLSDVLTAYQCSWREYPNMILALEPRARELAMTGVRLRPPTIEERDQSLDPKWRCSSPTTFLKELR